MPIYRGAQKVHPMPGGMEVARVYRGDGLVWERGPSFEPFVLSGTIGSRVLSQYTNTDLALSPGFVGQGHYLMEFGVTWQVQNNAAQKLTYIGYTISGPNVFGDNPISKQHDLSYPSNYDVVFQAFSSSSVVGQRTISNGWWKITRVA